MGSFEDLEKKGVDFRGLLREYGDPEKDSEFIENIKNVDHGLSQTMRQKIGIDQNYSSEESIDQIWLEIEVRRQLILFFITPRSRTQTIGMEILTLFNISGW